jgi:hypothetical protein|tara:strand:- start:1092 stop:1430 length:339 start_codon:yes stop_codon:yes gene_type:complete
LAVGTIIINTDLHTHADTLFASGTKILKLLYYAIDYNSTNTQLGLIDNPYTQQCYLSSEKAFTGSLVGNAGATDGTAPAMVPVFISADIGLRVFSSADSGSLIVVTYVEMTS